MPDGCFFFQYQAGSSRSSKKSQVAGGFGSGRSVEKIDQVFKGTLISLGFFQICCVYLGISGV